MATSQATDPGFRGLRWSQLKLVAVRGASISSQERLGGCGFKAFIPRQRFFIELIALRLFAFLRQPLGVGVNGLFFLRDSPPHAKPCCRCVTQVDHGAPQAHCQLELLDRCPHCQHRKQFHARPIHNLHRETSWQKEQLGQASMNVCILDCLYCTELVISACSQS